MAKEQRGKSIKINPQNQDYTRHGVDQYKDHVDMKAVLRRRAIEAHQEQMRMRKDGVILELGDMQ